MDAKTRTPEEIFGTHIRYVIPPFQRPYVWDEERQWQPLWEDVRRTAEHVLDAMEDGPAALKAVTPHFLGAVVLQHVDTGTGYIQSRNVVDGQQRLTTLQVLMDAVQAVVEKHGGEVDSEALKDLVLNNPKKVQHPDERYKVWPSRTDRDAFRAAMDGSTTAPDRLSGTLIVLAHDFFRREATDWAEVHTNPGMAGRRLSALTTALHRYLQLVAIDLSSTDNPQVIFETLNDRGTPLLAADLVKNYIFQAAEQAGADVDRWETKYWNDFDEPWWREGIAQGRMTRSRIDIFLQYWLTMRTQEEVPTEEVFKRFRRYAEHEGVHKEASAESLLAALRADANVFRRFADFAPDSPEGTFYYRVVEALQMGVVTPVLLWLLSQRNMVPEQERAKSLKSLESWIVRRMLLRLTTKDINRVMVALLKALQAAQQDTVGSATTSFLAAQTSPSRYWPLDEELQANLEHRKMYGVVQQMRLRMVLEAVEERRRSYKSESLHCPRNLQIEHVMPQKWRDFWDDGAASDPSSSAERDQAVQRIGNLTLVTDRLNPSLSNLPWTDVEAQKVNPNAQGKRSQIDSHSVLLLNRDLIEKNPDSWTEASIGERSRWLSEQIVQVWPGPQ